VYVEFPCALLKQLTLAYQVQHAVFLW